MDGAQRFRSLGGSPWTALTDHLLPSAPCLHHRDPQCLPVTILVAVAVAPTWKMASGMESALICTSSMRTVQVLPSAMTLRGLPSCALIDPGPHCVGR